MPRDVAGNYTLPSGENPVASGTVITSSWANTTLDDLAFAMTDSLSRTGDGGMLTALKFINGSASNPAIAFVNDITTGRYLFAMGDMRDTVNGVDVLRYNNGDVTLWRDPDWISIFQNAAEVDYDNNSSGLTATTVQAAIDELDTAVDPLAGDIATNAGDIATNASDIGDNATAITLKAPIASPTFTGVPAGPTAAPGTDTTQLATTAFVDASVAANVPESGNGPNGYYRKHADGFIEQWTYKNVGANNVTWTYPIPFTNSDSINVVGMAIEETSTPVCSTSGTSSLTQISLKRTGAGSLAWCNVRAVGY